MQNQMPQIVGEYQAGRYSVCVAVVTGMYVLMAAIALGYTDAIQWRWLPVAGAISYPLYLIHAGIGTNVIHILVRRTTLAPVWVLVGVTLALLPAAWAMHRWFERPLARLVRKMSLGGTVVEPKQGMEPRQEPGSDRTEGSDLPGGSEGPIQPDASSQSNKSNKSEPSEESERLELLVPGGSTPGRPPIQRSTP
jgi:hypothetical protein